MSPAGREPGSLGEGPFSTVGPDREGRLFRLSGERIAAVERVRPEPRRRVEPGRVNAHTHMYSGLAPLGLPPPEPEPRDFLEILERVWWRLDRALDPASLRAAARLYVAEALLAGTTTLIDHHESPAFVEGSLDVLAEACEELGIRALLCYGATERNGGREEARRGLAEGRRFLRASRDREVRGMFRRVRGVIGLHASFTVSDPSIEEAAAACREEDTVLHVHLAEDGADVRDAQERGYPGPLERLLAFDALPPGSILAHGVCCDSEQVRTAEERGIWFVQNPRSNRGNGVGYPAALSASARVAVGTDGYPSRMEEEAAVLREEARRHGDDPVAVEARLEAGWALASERFEERLGALASGATADLVVWEEGRIVEVRVAGEAVVAEGRLRGADLDTIRAEAATEAERLWERMARL